MDSVERKGGSIGDQVLTDANQEEESDKFPSAEQVIALLKRQGIEITLEQAEAVTIFLGQQTNIIISKFLRRCE